LTNAWSRSRRIQQKKRIQQKNALSVEAQDVLGSPPPELPDYPLMLCPLGRSVNVTYVT
jgi:hypothetical protein